MSDAKEAAAPKKKGKLMMIVAIALVLASGGGGAAWYFGMRGKHDEKEKHAEAPKKTVPIFLNLEPFVVNLAGSENYLQVGVVYALETNEIAELIKAQMPAVRSRVLLRLSAKSVAELASPEGKQKLTEEILEDARVSLEEPQRKSVVAMHFSAFVIQ